MWINHNRITEGEIDLIADLFKRPASEFKRHLMGAIFGADSANLKKLRLAFPSQVDAVTRYRSEPGYWEDVLKRSELYLTNEEKEQ